jgi:hypothetical protein
MARKSSKKRREERQRRLRKRLDALLGPQTAAAVIAGRVLVKAAVVDLGTSDRERAIKLATQLRGEMNR